MCIIEDMEHRQGATVNIPGSFIQADMECEKVHMTTEGKMAEPLTKLDPKL